MKKHIKKCFKKEELTKYLKQCFAILLIIFIFLNLLFVALNKISLLDFWLGIIFAGGASCLFYSNKTIKPEPHKTKTQTLN